MELLTIEDLENLGIGSAVLGSGGGGDPAYVYLMAKYLMEQYGPVKVISLEELEKTDYIIPLSIMGAPLINMERLLSGSEIEILLETIEKKLQKKPTVLMAGEIGGANAFTPLLAAAKLGLPILDADMLGRAFPELQMSSCNLKNLNCAPAVIVDCLQNSVVIETPCPNTLEKFARALTVSMGSSSAIGFYFMNGVEIQDAVIPNTLTHALRLGAAIKSAREKGFDPIQQLIDASEGVLLGKGTIIDIEQNVEKGFLQGAVTILDHSEKIELFYQNEYLLARRGAEILATTPDILVLLEETSGTPLTSEMLRYGLQVCLVAIPSPEIWQTNEGLRLVGPRSFGYDIEYRPVNQLIVERPS